MFRNFYYLVVSFSSSLLLANGANWVSNAINAGFGNERIGSGVVILQDIKTLVSLGGVESFERKKSNNLNHLENVQALLLDPISSWYTPYHVEGNETAFNQPSPRKNFIFEGPLSLEGYSLIPGEVSTEELIFAVFGGQHPYTGKLATNDLHLLHIYHAPGNSTIAKVGWSKPKVKGQPPGKRMLAAAAMLSNTLYIFGGYDNENEVQGCGLCPYMDDLYALKTNGNGTLFWEAPFTRRDPVDNVRPSARYEHSFDAVGSMMIMFGGSQYNYARKNEFQGDIMYLNELWVLDNANDVLQWRLIRFAETNPKPAPRGGHATAVVGSKVYVYGGHSIDRQNERHLVVYDDLWVLETADDNFQWEKASTTGVAPPGRTQHSFAVLQSASKAFSLGGIIQLTADFGDVLSLVDDTLHALEI